MKNITLSADEELIDAARRTAEANRTTLNAEFRRWLAEYSRSRLRAQRAANTLQRLREQFDTGGRKFTRDEMNER